MESFRDATGLTIPMVMNASEVGIAYGTAIDRLVVLDKAGFIRFEGSRYANLEIDTVKSVINRLLQE